MSAGTQTSAAPMVSIVVVSWNTRDLLRECLSSTISACRELPSATEIIVIDNDSKDGSAAMVGNEFPQVRVIANTANRGFAAATNQGLSEGRGRYLLLLNPDTKVSKSFLLELVSFLDKHPSAAVAGPRLVGKDGEQQVSCFPLPTLIRELWRLFFLDRLYEIAVYPRSRWRSEEPQQVESIQGACMLIRREALDHSGLLDERFFVYTEEVDLCRRLVDLNWQIFWVPQSVITHYGGESTSQVAARMFLQLYRSKVQYFRKHLGFPGALAYKTVLFVAALPRLIVPPLIIVVDPSRREKCRNLLRNYSSLVLALPGF